MNREALSKVKKLANQATLNIWKQIEGMDLTDAEYAFYLSAIMQSVSMDLTKFFGESVMKEQNEAEE